MSKKSIDNIVYVRVTRLERQVGYVAVRAESEARALELVAAAEFDGYFCMAAPYLASGYFDVDHADAEFEVVDRRAYPGDGVDIED